MNRQIRCLGVASLGLLVLSGMRLDARGSPRTLHLPDTPDRYAELDLPAHFRTSAARRFDNTPFDNPVTDAGATLGRVLFYDTRLSANDTTACASCHQQNRAFVDRERSEEHTSELQSPMYLV